MSSTLTNRDIFSLPTLPGSMLILGAGPIGIEMAQAFNRLGTIVTVIDRADQILPKEDRDMADAVQAGPGYRGDCLSFGQHDRPCGGCG